MLDEHQEYTPELTRTRWKYSNKNVQVSPNVNYYQSICFTNKLLTKKL